MGHDAETLAVSGNVGGGGIIDLPNLEHYLWADEAFKAGLIPADTNGDLIFLLNDQSDNDHNSFQTIEADRPTIQTANGQLVVRHDGASLMTAGNVLDSVLSGVDNKFSITMNVDNYSTTGVAYLLRKYAGISGQRQLYFEISNGKLQFVYVKFTFSQVRTILADASIGTGPHVVTVYYDGSIDTGDGADRVVFRVDGSEVSSSLTSSVGALFDIPDTTAPLTHGGYYNSVPTSNPVYGIAHDWSKQVILSDPSIEDIQVCENEMLADWGL